MSLSIGKGFTMNERERLTFSLAERSYKLPGSIVTHDLEFTNGLNLMPGRL